MIDWTGFENACNICTKCELYKYRKNVVIGRGSNLKAPIMFIGEGPGEQEDIRGLAFVGRAGILLDTLLKAQMFIRDDYYICNIVKCRPPNNRVPTEIEAKTCINWLRYQVKVIQPKIVVCLGSTAAKYIIDKDIKISRIRGQWIEKNVFDIMPTYHPAALLRNAKLKDDMWNDIKKVKERIESIKK